MGKQKQIKKLLTNNRQVLLAGETNNGICYDGIVNEMAYESQKLKVVALLKETNGDDFDGRKPAEYNDWDYAGWLKHQQVDNEPEVRKDYHGDEYEEKNVFYQSTFRKLCHWLAILFDLIDNSSTDWHQYMNDGHINVEKVRKSLDKVAVVNLKKSWGSKQTNSIKLWQYTANQDIQDTLRKQMDILEADLVLCCSPDVFGIANMIFNTPQNDIIKIESSIIKNKVNKMFIANGTAYINFYHPQYYGKTDEVFADYAAEVFSWALEMIHLGNNPSKQN